MESPGFKVWCLMSLSPKSKLWKDCSTTHTHTHTHTHIHTHTHVVIVKSPSHVQLFVIPWTAVCKASLSLTTSQSLSKFMPIALVMPSSHLILWFLLLLSSIFPRIKGFSNESTVQIRGPKYWSLSISPSSEYSGLISLRLTGLNPSLSKAPIIWHSAFYMI